MKMQDAEFEESEYRSALFNQLFTDRRVWEPGQVFEKHIGVDKAGYCVNDFIFLMHGVPGVPAGVYLPAYRLYRFWGISPTKKKLPTFKLNLFVQAKRPKFARRVPKSLKTQGLGSPFWKFETKPHQQNALELLGQKLGKRALITYASPAFHKQKDLYKWTIDPQMIEKSTFPSAVALSGHKGWNYCVPGAVGVANQEPTNVQEPLIMERIANFIEQDNQVDDGPFGTLFTLAEAVKNAAEQGGDDDEEGDFLRARFFEFVRIIPQVVSSYGMDPGLDRDRTVAFLTVKFFTLIFRLDWYVLGSKS